VNPVTRNLQAGADLTRRRLWLTLGWMGVVLVILLSLMPNPPQGHVRFEDKIGHVLAYFSLMFWFAQLHGRWLPWALGFLALGAGLEGLQGLSGYREMSLNDLLANASGIGLGWLAAWRIPRLLQTIEARLP
jgi:VanZ family protein